MARSSGGVMALVSAPFVAGKKILSAAVNNNFADMVTELTDSLSRTGKGGMLADLAMGGFKVTNIAAATNPADAVRFDQFGDALSRSGANAASADLLMGGKRLTNLGAGVAASDAARIDQLPSVPIVPDTWVGSYGVTGSAIYVPLPGGSGMYRLELRGITTSAFGGLGFWLSSTSGVSWMAGATDYRSLSLATSEFYSTPQKTVGDTSYGSISTAASGSPGSPCAIMGTLDIDPQFRMFRASIRGGNPNGLVTEDTAGYWRPAGTVNYIAIVGVGGTLTGGAARCVRWG